MVNVMLVGPLAVTVEMKMARAKIDREYRIVTQINKDFCLSVY
jgi:hypothetical protein